MAFKLLLLTLAVTQVLGQDQLNCHLVDDNLSALFDDTSFSGKCTHLIIMAGAPQADGKVRPIRDAILQRARQAQEGRADLKVLVEVVIRPEHVEKLANDDYVSNMASSLKNLARNNPHMNGVVIHVDHNYERQNAGPSGEGNVIRLVAKIRSYLISYIIGVVAGTRGPLNSISIQGCQDLSQLIDFIELNAETFELDGRREPKADRSGSPKPIEDGGVDEKVVQLSNTLLDSWRYCTALENKTFLTMPMPVAIQEQPGEARATQLSYQTVCNENIIWYEGADLPLIYIKKRVAPDTFAEVAYWLSYANGKTVEALVQNGRQRGVAGFSFLPLNYDDTKNACGKGPMPLFNQLVNLMNQPLMNQPLEEPKSSVSDATKLQEICQVMAKHC
ncbi:hypothetical protein HDE_03954 [Halotydeus destructor]|nr:hypothetical protein HDE_03954 [Halotydeus destructor]